MLQMKERENSFSALSQFEASEQMVSSVFVCCVCVCVCVFVCVCVCVCVATVYTVECVFESGSNCVSVHVHYMARSKWTTCLHTLMYFWCGVVYHG